MSSPRQLITLQLWIDNRLHVEQIVNAWPTAVDVARASNALYSSYKITIAKRPWFIVRVGVQSKMNGNLEQYAGDVEPYNKLKTAA